MNGWEDVLGLVDTTEAVTTTDEVLVAASSMDPGRLVADLTESFGSNDDLSVIRLIVDGDDRGVVGRLDAYQLAKSLGRGSFGGGDYATVPGAADYTLFRLTCPTPGCRVHGRALEYPKPPPTCGVHHVALLVEAM